MMNDFEVTLNHLVEFGKGRFKKYPYTEYGNELRIDDEVYALLGYVTEMKLLTDDMIDTIVAMAEHMNDNLNQVDLKLDTFLNNFDGKLKDSLTNILSEWQESGKLDVLIDESLHTEMDILEEETNKKLNDFNAQLAQTMRNIQEFPRLEGETDDTGRFKRLIEATPEGNTAFVPYQDDWYIISDTIAINKRISFVSKGKIGYKGLRDRSAFLLGATKQLIGLVFDIYKLADGNNASDDYETNYGGYHGWENDNYIGVEAINLKWATINIFEVRNFSTGVRFSAQAGDGYWFNKHNILNLTNNRVHMEINSDGGGAIPSWFNANYFNETSFGYGTSHKPFMDDQRMKYGILQTLTNGNRYGGNSNIFTNMKFETHGSFPYGYTQIKTVKSSGWRFDSYREELLGTNNTLIDVDLTVVEDGVITINAHSNDIIMNPLTHKTGKIKFSNTQKVNGSLSTIARFVVPPKNIVLLEENNLLSKARKYDGNYLGLEGYHFTTRATNSWTEVTDRSYGGNRNKECVSLTGTYPLVLFLENLKKGDEITVYANGGGNLSSVALELYDKSKLPLASEYIGNEKALAAYGYYNPSSKQFTFHNISEEYKFTINSEFLGYIKILVSGNVNNIRVESTSKDMKLLKFVDERIADSHYSNTKPLNAINGGFKVGETVLNTNKTAGQPIGWYLSSALVWEPFGTQS